MLSRLPYSIEQNRASADSTVKKIDSTDLGAMGMWMKRLSGFKGEIKSVGFPSCGDWSG